MSSSTPTPLIDHIVILIPHFFLITPPPWFTTLFHFYPGGRHADGLTENTLALLADGSYLEFIAFVPGIDPAKRAAHHWGSKEEGTVVDWALTLSSDAVENGQEKKGEEEKKAFREIQNKIHDANMGIVYNDLQSGGRLRPDGEVLKWEVAFPKGAGGDEVERGIAPFWCLDVTPRQLRVPYRVAPEFTKHPTGAVGVAKVEVLVGSDKTIESAGGVYDVLFGKNATGDVVDGKAEWKVGSLAGQGVHSGSVVHLGKSDKGKGLHINISFFTDDDSLVGKSVGGKVDDEHTLTFSFVAAFSST